MFGILLGFPAGIVVFLVVNSFLGEWGWVGDPCATAAVSACLGLCAYYGARGIDEWLNQRKDNPKPFGVKQPLPEVFGTIKQVFAESMYGPFSWHMRTIDSEEGRIVASLNFTEMLGEGVSPMQAHRAIMVEIFTDPVSEEEKQPMLDQGLSGGHKEVTRVQINWDVHSPVVRTTVNGIIDDYTRTIKEALGPVTAVVTEWKPQLKSPFEPPAWVVVLTVMSAFFAFYRYDQHVDSKKSQVEDKKQIEDKGQAESESQGLKRWLQEADERARQMKEAQQKLKEFQDSQYRDWLKSTNSPVYVPPNMPPGLNRYLPSLNSFWRKYKPLTLPLVPKQENQDSDSSQALK